MYEGTAIKLIVYSFKFWISKQILNMKYSWILKTTNFLIMLLNKMRVVT